MKYATGTRVRINPARSGHSQVTDHCEGVVVGASGDDLLVEINGQEWGINARLVESLADRRYRQELTAIAKEQA